MCLFKVYREYRSTPKQKTGDKRRGFRGRPLGGRAAMIVVVVTLLEEAWRRAPHRFNQNTWVSSVLVALTYYLHFITYWSPTKIVGDSILRPAVGDIRGKQRSRRSRRLKFSHYLYIYWHMFVCAGVCHGIWMRECMWIAYLGKGLFGLQFSEPRWVDSISYAYSW